MVKQQITPSASALERAFRRERPWLQLLLAGARVATGQTPKEAIWTRNKATLYRYVPQGEIRFPVPLLLVYALIDRPFILDLIPGNSFVEYLVEQGFDVYLLDWGFRATRTTISRSTTMCSTIFPGRSATYSELHMPRRSPSLVPASAGC